MKKIAIVGASLAMLAFASVSAATEAEMATTDYNSPVYAMSLEANQYLEITVIPAVCERGDSTCASITTEDAALHYWKGKAFKAMAIDLKDPLTTGIVVGEVYGMSDDYAVYMGNMFEMGYLAQ